MNFQTKTIDDAYKATNRSPFEMPQIPGLREEDLLHIKNHFDLEVVVEAINQEANKGKRWIPDFTNSSEKKYELWYWIEPSDTDGAGFVFSSTFTDYGHTLTTVGSRLCYISREAANYCFTQFPELHKAQILKKQ
jgi:hypothetical protein